MEHTTRGEWVTRTALVLGLGAFLVHLVWRVVAPLDTAPLWLSTASLVLEVLGVGCSAVLAWALWPMARPAGAAGGPHPGDVDVVVVRDGDETVDDLRTTLVALRSARALGRVTVVDRSGRLAVAGVAAEFEVGFVVPEPSVLDAVRSVARSSFVLVLSAGDVPVPDIVDRLLAAVDGDDVAVVQGMGVSLVGDAPERGIDLRHDLLFERSGLNPALGVRGCAQWLGSGSLVRSETLEVVVGAHGEGLGAVTEAGSRLVAAGWRVVCAAGAPVVAHRAPADRLRSRADQAARDHALLRRLWSRSGPAWPRENRSDAVLSTAAWSVRVLSPYGVVAAVALVSTVLLSGRLPYDVASPVVLLVGLPGAAATSVGLGLASGWTLRPGDRTRRALTAGGRVWSGPVLTVAVLGLVLVARVVSDRVLHVAPLIGRSQLSVMVLVATWLLGISFDVLRDESRRGRVARAPRATSSLSAVFGERAVSVVDLTTRGAGLRSPSPMNVGDRAVFEAALPTRSGVTSVSVDATVRNVRAVGPDWRIGVEFGRLDPVVANALAEYCVIETSRLHLGVPLHSDGVPVPGANALHWVADATGPGRGRVAATPIAQPSKP